MTEQKPSGAAFPLPSPAWRPSGQERQHPGLRCPPQASSDFCGLLWAPDSSLVRNLFNSMTDSLKDGNKKDNEAQSNYNTTGSH